ncbi:hypothetical protein GA707_14665 [Nostocoides sp. F2B08]|uniref:stealth conserved region 3 domain-containing protein n=1 Tax=Nostocoides sp. F2B08 TaxID=2653936 RepID=UPI001263AF35|nr:stealth conserved region 3 domain-containing protein [Tetrasphaera sp. F2B08]KAB7743337.1 hypothetical protein GA707_14665 [Tetrasphaera sp. F2B08]
MSEPEADAVVTWVDDRDDHWRSLRDSHAAERGVEPRAQDYRSWDNLIYWFRAIDRFCPWIRLVHLVTENPVPDWLDAAHPRLRVVRHGDFIPAEYLPTFNSHVIELQLHRIPDLAANFVYFNDDTFPLRPLSLGHFFPRGKPAGIAALSALSIGDPVNHALLNSLDLVNRHFDKRSVIRRNPAGWFARVYGPRLLAQTVSLLPWPRFTGFHNSHLPQALRRASFERVWAAGEQQLEETSRSRFRSPSDVHPYVFSHWQVCVGDFTPVSPRGYGRSFQLGIDSAEDVARAITSGRLAQACINDGPLDDFEQTRDLINGALAELLPRPSSFERT